MQYTCSHYRIRIYFAKAKQTLRREIREGSSFYRSSKTINLNQLHFDP